MKARTRTWPFGAPALPSREALRRAGALAFLWLLALLPAALAFDGWRHTLEGRMSLHMLVEFPFLFGAGWAAQRLLARRMRARPWLRGLAWVDWRGWGGALFATLVALAWMIPSALDAALLSAPVDAVKIASWWAAGFWLAASWRRMDGEVALFALGNIAWMMATAGMLYQQAPQALCVNYLRNDQLDAGIGLVVAAGLLGVVALRRALVVFR
ncbi:MAG: hypothetical protein KGI35_01515 [Burkholderiales bacterium]|nr:hypothetical protein [Burkholderiales bacterium]MDE2394850.1 hypothetical protein [Burkholderiales bacterium]